MNINLGNIMPRFFAAPTQSQLNAQAAVGGGTDTARDKVQRDKNKTKRAHLMGNAIGNKRVLDKETKITETKKKK
ncbi:MAG: hypothetical protein R3C68_03340 [Myxococcota bacterium]